MVAQFQYSQLANLSDSLIRQFGGKAKLRRQSGDRTCYAVDVDYLPAEHRGQLKSPVERVYLVSSKGLTLPPNHELDSLVTLNEDGSEDEVLKIFEPVGRLRPNTTTIYYELHVR